MNLEPRADDPPAPPRLVVELVPRTSWFRNLRALVAASEWDRLRRSVYRAANWRCEICGGGDHPVECHELWRYDDATGVQSLERLVALCPDCHRTIHVGLSSVHGRYVEARAHLARVNGWTLGQAEQHIQEAFARYAVRSRRPWRLELSALRRYGVAPPATGHPVRLTDD